MSLTDSEKAILHDESDINPLDNDFFFEEIRKQHAQANINNKLEGKVASSNAHFSLNLEELESDDNDDEVD